MTAARKNRGWLWYFVIVLVLAIAATVWLGVFNLRQQLQREQLDAARKLWEKNGPKDYRFLYTTRRNDEPRVDRFVVVVRNGKVISVTLNDVVQIEERSLRYHSMPALFDSIETFLVLDADPKRPRTHARGLFDAKD